MATAARSARRKRAAKRPRNAHEKVVQPGGVSWQARLLNFVTRHVIKRPVERRGLNPRTARTVVRRMELLTSGFRRFVGSRRATIAGVPCDIVLPRNPPAVERTILYLHGGGFFLHLPRSYKHFAHRLADRFGATVYLPDYRLAPEHRHPAAPDDCLAVYQALLDDGCDPARMAIMGDSAGGNLALVTLLRARDIGLPLPACATLLSPGADLTFSGASYQSNARADPLVPMIALHQVTMQYVDTTTKAHPHASPMLGDLSGLPPLSILVGSTEVLLDSSISTAQLCQAAGGRVTLQIWEEMPHVFPLFHFLPEGKIAMQHMLDFFNKHTLPAKPG
mgnify:CR=1 FL=1|jgi:monoterpene epsilon-lactone hydrolase